MEQEKRTELYVTLGVELVTLLTIVSGFLPAQIGVELMAKLAGIYVGARTLLKLAKVIVKFTKTTADDEIVKIIEEVINQTQDKMQK